MPAQASPFGTAPPAPPGTPTPASFSDVITGMAKKYRIDPRVALAIAKTESWNPQLNDFDPNAVSPAGARGIMQLMPATMARRKVNPTDPYDNIRGGLEEFRQLLDENGNDVDLALRRYNASPGAPRAVTDPYVQKVFSYIQPQPQEQPSVAPPTPPWWQATKDFASEATKGLRAIPAALGAANSLAVGALQHPVESARAVNEAIQQGFWHPVDTANKLFGTQIGKMREAYDQGDYVRAGLEAKNIPLQAVGMGGRMGEAEDFMRKGEIAKGLGATADIAGTFALPELAAEHGLPVVPRLFKPRLTPAETRAVQLGEKADVPMSAATVSGSGFARAAEYVTQSTPIGNVIARIKARETAEKMEALGQELGGRVHPMPLSGTDAARSSMDALTARRDLTAADGRSLYQAVEQAAADPIHTRQVPVGMTNQWTPQGTLQQVPIMGPMQMPVDIRVAKATFKSLYDDMTRRRLLLNESELEGLNALEHFVNGPDYVPLTQIERDLGSLKRLARGGEEGNRTVSQGLAAKGVGTLQQEIDNVARAAGPDVVDALQEARKAWASQSATQDVLDRLKGTYAEPVEGFRRLTTPGNLEFLKTVAAETPREIPKIARAYLEEMFTRARGLEGGWKRMEAMAGEWEKMHPEMKQLLYGPNADDLDSFFLLGRRIAENPNPSGTGRAVIASNVLTTTFFSPLYGGAAIGLGGLFSAALNTRAGVKLLTEGYRIPAGTAGAAAWTAAVARMVDEAREQEGPGQAATAPPPPPGAHASSPPPPPPFNVTVPPRIEAR